MRSKTRMEFSRGVALPAVRCGRSARVLVMAAVVAFGCAGTAQAAYVTVYGGPTYDPTTGNGYNLPTVGTERTKIVNASGTAAGQVERYVSGSFADYRAVRWDTSGFTVLGNLGTGAAGYANSDARAINSAGTAVGYATKYLSGVNMGDRAVRWNAGTTAATELGNLGVASNGSTTTYAYAINTAGSAVGIALKYDQSNTYLGSRAVRWDAGGTVATELGNIGTTPGGYTAGAAHAINTAGTAVGTNQKYDANGNDLGVRAVRWQAGSTAATELGNLGTYSSGYTDNVALAVNDTGTAVGWADKFDSAHNLVGQRAVRWDASGTTATQLGSLPTSNGSGESEAYAINAAGTAVGYADKYVSSVGFVGQRAARWDAGGTTATELQVLGTAPDGTTSSTAVAINTSGIIAGFCQKYDASGNFIGGSAVYWNPDGSVVDLNSLIDPNSGWTLDYAMSISDTDWIAGYGMYDPDGPGGAAAYERYFTLQVPEPASGALLALGAPLLVWRRRRK